MAKSDKSNRRQIADQIRAKQKRADQRQGAIIVGVCVVFALVIVGIAAYKPIKDWWDLREFRDKDLSSIGSSPEVCGKPIKKKASGTQEHVDPGTPVPYTDNPPAFGKHEQYPDDMKRKLYTTADRPRVEMLVHNLEHGYTILWYDETLADDDEQMTELRAIATKLQGTDNQRLKFKAVPWTDKDGDAFPTGKRAGMKSGETPHIAITHWSKGGQDASVQDVAKQRGVWQYCSEVSGEALFDFMNDYPYLDSPEPDGM